MESFTDIWSTEVMNCASATFSLCRDGNKSRRWALIGRPKSHFYFWLCGFADLCRHWQRHWVPKLSIVFWIWMLNLLLESQNTGPLSRLLFLWHSFWYRWPLYSGTYTSLGKKWSTLLNHSQMQSKLCGSGWGSVQELQAQHGLEESYSVAWSQQFGANLASQ